MSAGGVGQQAELRVAVVGAGVMGADHVGRLTSTITGVRVCAVVEPDEIRARAAAQLAPGSQTFSRLDDAIDAGLVDAVLVAAPGRFHEPVILTALEAGLPVLCEKPLTEEPESSWRLIEAEQKVGRRLVQVGFMRRFDPQYLELKNLIDSGSAGELLMLHLAHRAPSVPPMFTNEMRITDSAAHEFDIVPWLARSSIRSLDVRVGKTTPLAGAGVGEPMQVLLQLQNELLVDLEINLSSQYGYQVTTEAVFERGVARIGQPTGLQLSFDGALRIEQHQSFTTRFREAYDLELQGWVDATRRGVTAGPSIWDGYTVAVACAAGVRALAQPGAVQIDLPPVPELYRNVVAV